MTLTVRLKPELESALESYCAARGVTKSLVVQQVLAEYLVRPQTARYKRRAAATRGAMPAEPGAAYKAFERAGFIGGGTSNGKSATKDVVRERIRQHFAAKERKRRA